MKRKNRHKHSYKKLFTVRTCNLNIKYHEKEYALHLMFWKWDFFVLFVTYKNVSLIWIRHHCRFNNSPKRDIWCVPPGHGTSVPAVSILFLHSATRLLRIFSKAVHHGSITLCLFCFSTTIKFEFIILLPFIWSNISIIWKLFVIHKSLISLDSRSPMLCTSESLIRLLFLALLFKSRFTEISAYILIGW